MATAVGNEAGMSSGGPTVRLSFAFNAWVKPKPIHEGWNKNTLTLVLPGDTQVLDILSYCTMKTEERCTGKNRNLVLEFMPSPTNTKDGRTVAFHQLLIHKSKAYRVGNVVWFKNSNGLLMVESTIIPEAAHLALPTSEKWNVQLTGAPEERVFIALDEFTETPRAFPLFFWKKYYDKDAEKYVTIRGDGLIEEETMC